MTRLLAIALIAALPVAAYCLPARAQDTAAWGRMPQFVVQLVPGRYCDAEIHAQNRVTGGLMSPTFATLRLDNLAVLVRVDHADGDLPDTVTVTPPEGWIAVPPSIVLQEDQAGIIEICLAVGS